MLSTYDPAAAAAQCLSSSRPLHAFRAYRRTFSWDSLVQHLLLPGGRPLARRHKASGRGGAPGVDHAEPEESESV